MKIEGTFYNIDPEFADELKKKNGKALTSATNKQFSFLSMMGRPEAAPTEHTPKVSLIVGQSSGEAPQVKVPVAWQAPEEPLNWLKEVLEKGFFDPEQTAHPIFAAEKAEHLSGSWKKTKEHFVQLSKSRKKLAVKNMREKQFQHQKTDGINDGPEKKKPSDGR